MFIRNRKYYFWMRNVFMSIHLIKPQALGHKETFILFVLLERFLCSISNEGFVLIIHLLIDLIVCSIFMLIIFILFAELINCTNIFRLSSGYIYRDEQVNSVFQLYKSLAITKETVAITKISRHKHNLYLRLSNQKSYQDTFEQIKHDF